MSKNPVRKPGYLIDLKELGSKYFTDIDELSIALGTDLGRYLSKLIERAELFCNGYEDRSFYWVMRQQEERLGWDERKIGRLQKELIGLGLMTTHLEYDKQSQTTLKKIRLNCPAIRDLIRQYTTKAAYIPKGSIAEAKITGAYLPKGRNTGSGVPPKLEGNKTYCKSDIDPTKVGYSDTPKAYPSLSDEISSLEVEEKQTPKETRLDPSDIWNKSEQRRHRPAQVPQHNNLELEDVNGMAFIGDENIGPPPHPSPDLEPSAQVDKIGQGPPRRRRQMYNASIKEVENG